MRKLKRSVAIIISILLIANVICIKNVQAYDDVNLLSKTSITAEQAAAWAKEKGATSEFINLAQLYWKYFSTHGNVNPAIAYVQSALETGYGKFGGVIDATYKNPCGLKTTQGGDNSLPSSHAKFATWDLGVQAHLDHIALYAGAYGYPRTNNTPDPRHFSYLKGIATTVTQLGSSWASNTTYGDSILKLYWELNEKANNLKPNMYVDSVKDGAIIEDTTFVVSGWALNLSGVKEIQVYVDNILKNKTTVGGSRLDVEKVFPEYPYADTSGYSCRVDASQLSSGMKTLRVVAVGNDNASASISRTIYIRPSSLAPRMNVDSPAQNTSLNTDSVNIRGWALNGTGIKKVQVYVDNVLKGETTASQIRWDVRNAFPQYPNAQLSGFSYNLNTNSLSTGPKTLKIVTIGNDGKSTTNSRTIYIRPSSLTPRMNIDSPVQNTVVNNDSVNISGWALNGTGVNKVQVYVDNVLKGETTASQIRWDVRNVFPQYPNAQLSGFSYNLNTQSLTSGAKTLKVIAVGNDGKTTYMTKNITIKRPLPLIMRLDSASQTQTVKGATTTFTGWAINGAGIKEVRIYVDGNQVGTTNVGLSRTDVGNSYSQYPNSATSGYSYQLNIAQYSQGNKNIKVVAVGNDGATQEAYTTLNIVKPLIVVDPGHNQGGDYGCESKFDGVTYSETTLTMQTAVKLQSELVNRGYRVQLTRQPWDNLTDDMTTSLHKRADLANSLKADAFISLHYNSAGSSANGIQTFYSTYKPGLKDVQSDLAPLTSGYDGYKDTNPTAAGIKSRTFAKNVENALTSKCNYNAIGWDQDQHGYLDRNLYVTKYTNMPATLIELGFLSNSGEAKRCADSNEQLAKSKVIADEVSKMF
ncbi:N-acetylmuramoyl-L-alanine amidase [Inconstantimicrobium mannanitabidum]|uniref:Uncharacterized protein n=1 Tax=Inconstantimicrobium mannanitabidum TaxID=1604901 RepID=A0ACB5RFE5_9CLOT|nr:N-acetylmuramoyl-L-alanine amidase [Clostridium sp. TW13]GKX67802.1 hypothetical protein rsdtw13_30600 [Clostridium sp. TW13]